jgi:hypothetical protein
VALISTVADSWSDTTWRRPHTNSDPFYTRADVELSADDYHVRTLLEVTLHALRTKARRELNAVIGPADERVLQRTLNNPFADPDLPWWMRRIGV